MKKYLIEIVLAVAIAAFVIVFSYLSIKRYATLHSYYYDLGIMNQVVDNTSRGHILEMTNQDLKQNLNRLAIHFDPILALFAPIYILYRSPAVLLVAQALILGLGALAIYLIGHKVLKNKPVSLVFSITYLMYFQVQRAVLFDFHAVVLATTLLLFAFYFNLAKKGFLYFLFLVLSLLTKEHVGMVVTMFGLYLVFIKRERRVGLATLGLGLTAFVSTVFFIIPYFRQEGHFALRYFENFGDSPSQILINLFTHPLTTLNQVVTPESLEYVKHLVSPLFYAVFSPLTLLVGLPELAINMLSINSNMRSYFFHYSSLVVPVLFYALILGYRKFNSLVRHALIRQAVFSMFVILNILSIYSYNPVPAALVRRPAVYSELDPIKQRSINLLMDKLKDENVRLSTTPRLAPFFTNRRYYHSFLFDTAYASMGLTEEDVMKDKLGSYAASEYVIIDKEEIGDVSEGSLRVKFYQHLRNNKDFFQVASDDQDIEVFTRRDNTKSLITEDIFN